jgi:hypothetical protein
LRRGSCTYQYLEWKHVNRSIDLDKVQVLPTISEYYMLSYQQAIDLLRAHLGRYLSSG